MDECTKIMGLVVRTLRDPPGEKTATGDGHGPKVLFLPEPKFSERHEMSVRLKNQIVISLALDESLNSLARDDLYEIVS